MPTDPTTTAVALLQMLSGDFGPSVSFTKPWPQFVRVFNEYPLRAASIARELFRARDPKFMPFILSFPWDEQVPMLPRELHSSEFLTTMLEIVSDESWYKQMREIAAPDGSVGDSLLPHHLYWSLNCLGKLFIVDKGQVQRPQSVNLCLQCIPRFPMLWKLLWEYRDLVLVPNFAGIDGGVFVIVRYLVECHFFLVKQFQESVPHLSTHAAHIALLLWNRAREPRYNVKITASLIVGMFEEQHINRPEHISHFISTAVPVVVGHQDPLEIFFNSLMSKEKDMLEPKNLYNNVFLSTVILQGCPKKVDLKKEGDRRKVLFTLARAFHRYQCGGSVIADRRIGWRIPTVFLNSLNFIFKCDRQGVVDDILYNPVDLGFMPVLISALESVDFIYGDTLFEATVEWLTTGYKHYAEKMRFSGHEGATHNYAYLRRILQSRWLPILELMRSALRSPDFQSRDTAPLQRIKQLWEDLGSSYRLSKKSKELDSAETLIGYVKSAEREGGCAWRECACFGRRGVWHRTRRVCKGCWVAVYCCERCQKGDWKLGHRDVCVGRRIRPTE